MSEKIPSKEDISIEFQKATSNDIPVLLGLEKSVADSHFYSPILEEEEWVEELQNVNVFLIKQGDVVVGNIAYECKGVDHVYISELVIHPDFQRKGLGRQALTMLLDTFKDIQCIDVITHPENPVRALYESLGFVVTEQKEDYYGDGEPRLVLELFRK